MAVILSIDQDLVLLLTASSHHPIPPPRTPQKIFLNKQKPKDQQQKTLLKIVSWIQLLYI